MVSIRKYADTDQQQVRDLIHQIMNEEFHQESAAYPTEDIERINQAYGGLGEAFFVATIDDKIVGTVAIKREDDRVALLRRLFVSASHRNQRIGLKLIDRALQFCDEVGYKEVIFKTTSRMKSAALVCQKRGFVPRAHLNLGPVELLKFSLSLRDGWKKKLVGQ